MSEREGAVGEVQRERTTVLTWGWLGWQVAEGWFALVRRQPSGDSAFSDLLSAPMEGLWNYEPGTMAITELENLTGTTLLC